ncbi:alkaline phosphatase D [Raineyella antarctica]|uniref:Alkaline phosphatase D n=1 Tax=Raineyella antarctica TaxID=1577474 RepID=A0A1G6GVX9_9ACTN|nr:alkaline phosphatase D family protein [Raineyella antarctica]SDB86192.1 alkaline phosphatase D [Raineyella antarctica]
MTDTSSFRTVPVRRRALMQGFVAASAAGLLGTGGTRAAAAPLVSHRLTLTSGIASGDVTSDSAVLWARSSGAGTLRAVVRAVDVDGNPLKGKYHQERVLTGPAATTGTDFTARLRLDKLAPATRFEYRLGFVDAAGHTGQEETGTFTTAPGSRYGRKAEDLDQTFVWTADTAGQGWGINEEIGGMFGYRAMLATAPDFFLHSGDTVYADGPMASAVTEPDGNVWKNLLIDEVTQIAQSLADFRGRHRYNYLDANVRALAREVPIVATWDDHEVTNNWYPGEVLDDPRYDKVRDDPRYDKVRDVDTLARWGRQAFDEYYPRTSPTIHRRIARGPQLDVFCLDMRTYKSPNTAGLESTATRILGEEQLQWLIEGLRTSTATWKVIANDLPIGLVVPDGAGMEAVANNDPGAPLGRELEIARLLKAIKDHDIKNVVFLTGDVHYCAAHHYSPERAVFKDFKPFWEFVAGPINAGSFGPNKLDATFGPEQVFERHGFTNQSPRSGEHQYFGHVAVAGDGAEFVVSLVNANGDTVYTKALIPEA